MAVLVERPVAKSEDSIEIETDLGRWKRLRSAVRESARLHELELASKHARFYMAMVTLTLREDATAEPRDVANYLKCVRMWCVRRGIECRYVWVGELQQRGALHYHVLFWLPKGISMPKPDKQGWWKLGSTKIEAARCAVGYMTKYASKIRSKQKEGVGFPKGFRMHGCGGLTGQGRETRAYHLLPEWAQELGVVEDKLRRNIGGGFVSKLTGECWPSPWAIVGFRKIPGRGPVVTIVRIR